jgi:putative RNA 2'-phosphotransferase
MNRWKRCSTSRSGSEDNMGDLKRLSKFLALILRHKAEEFGISLDSSGFASFDAVWSQVQRRYPGQYSYKDLLLLLDSEGGKQRYELQQGRIRALYGHSTVEVVYEAAVPPEILYHGTTEQALNAIRREGLTSQNRQYVHLSTDTQRAEEVAGRHSRDTVILKIRALEAHNAGLEFYHPEPRHYLVKAVSPDYIDFPE